MPTKLPDRIMAWVRSHYGNPRIWEMVFQDLLDVATGSREGNPAELRHLAEIFPELTQ